MPPPLTDQELITAQIIRKRGQIAATSPLEGLLQRAVIGGSRRRLSETFGDDETEHKKIMRFLTRP